MSRSSVTVLVSACALALALPAAAHATLPEITGPPTISGLPQVGRALTVSAQWTGTPVPKVAWAWLRCSDAAGACATVLGATDTTYVLTDADAGSVLRARLSATNRFGTVEQVSAPTGVIAPATGPGPEPTATPAPLPAPPPPPPPAPVAAPAATPVPKPVLRSMTPFPVIRIKGQLGATGSRITLFSLSGPRGAAVKLTCRGGGCPQRSVTVKAPVAHLRGFERFLPAGTRIVVTVTMPGRIGKWTSLLIRRGEAPQRRDRCIGPTATTPSPCAG